MWLNHIFFFCLLGFFVFVLCYSELCIIIIFIITIIAHKTFAVNVNRTTYICAHTHTHNSRSSYLNPPSTLSSTTKLIPPNWIFYTIYIYFYRVVRVFAFARLHLIHNVGRKAITREKKMVSVNFCCGFFCCCWFLLRLSFN